MTTRLGGWGRGAAIALLVTFVGAATTTAQHQDREVEELRKEIMRLQDQNLELARRMDAEKARLLQEKDGLLRELAALRRRVLVAEAQAAGQEAPPAGQALLTFDFDGAPLDEALRALREQSKQDIASLGAPEGVTVTLRGRDVPWRLAVELVALNGRLPSGDRAPLKVAETPEGAVRVMTSAH